MKVYIIAFITYAISSACANIPPEMLHRMDTNVNPCEDFYMYSCGNWLRNTRLPHALNRIDTSRMEVDAHIDKVMMELIQTRPPIVRELWYSCMAFDTITNLGNEPLRIDINRIYEAQTKLELMELAGDFARTGGSAFVKFNVKPNKYDSKHYTLHLSPELTLPTRYYSSDQFSSIREEYAQYITTLMDLADFTLPMQTRGKRKRDSLRPYSEIVIEIEKKLANLKKRFASSTTPMTVEYASKYFPKSFETYMKGMLFNIQQELTIYLPVNYLNEVEDMLRSMPRAELRVYIAYRMIHSRVQWLGHDFDQVWYRFFRQFLKKQRQSLPRDRICRNNLRQYLPDLIGSLFNKKSFEVQREKTALEMIQWIKEVMNERISLMDLENERGIAEKKLNKLTTLVGESKIPRTYPVASTLSPDNYPKNMYNIMSHSFDEEMKKVGQTRNPEEWSMSPIEPNAYYIPDRNTLVLPAGVLQPPYFHGSDVHPAINFGAIGTIIGHELIHGFDAKGSAFNEDGDEFPWWSPSTQSAYGSHVNCYKNQYSGFVEDQRNVKALDETIADNGGMSLAWGAYRKYMNNVKKDIHVDSKVADRMFFVAFGQNWCEKFTDDMTRYHLAKSDLLAGKWRVNGVVMNSQSFATTFECKPNTPMNPSEKCKLWQQV